MNTTAAQKKRLLIAADWLEQMAKTLPRWNPHAGERWDIFLTRSYEAEKALGAELRRTPGCKLFMCEIRQRVDLTLGGISVHSKHGLARACLDWVDAVRARYGGPEGS